MRQLGALLLLAVLASTARAACGDGMVDVGEGCDPGPDLPADCCAADCQLDSATCSGMSGTCEADVCVRPLAILRVRVRPHGLTRPTNGSIYARGEFTVADPLDPFGTGTGVAAQVTDGLNLDRSFSWTPAECVTFPRGGIRCVNAAGKKLRFDQTRSGPPLYRFNMRWKGLDTEGPFQPPITIRIMHSHGIDRLGAIITVCATLNNGALDCRGGG